MRQDTRNRRFVTSFINELDEAKDVPSIRHFLLLQLNQSWWVCCDKQKQTLWPESASELYRPSDHRLSAKLVPTFADRGVSRSQRGGSLTAVISVFVNRSRYVFFQVVPQLYSRGWVDPVPDPLLLRKSGSVANRTRTSGSVARNSVH
jgi:hypothetical protein